MNGAIWYSSWLGEVSHTLPVLATLNLKFFDQGLGHFNTHFHYCFRTAQLLWLSENKEQCTNVLLSLEISTVLKCRHFGEDKYFVSSPGCYCFYLWLGILCFPFDFPPPQISIFSVRGVCLRQKQLRIIKLWQHPFSFSICIIIQQKWSATPKWL